MRSPLAHGLRPPGTGLLCVLATTQASSQRKPASSFSSNPPLQGSTCTRGQAGVDTIGQTLPGAGVGCGLLLALPRGWQSGHDTRPVLTPSPETLLSPGLKRTFHSHPWRAPSCGTDLEVVCEQPKETRGRQRDVGPSRFWRGQTSGGPRPFPACGSPPNPRSGLAQLSGPHCCPHASAAPCPQWDLTPVLVPVAFARPPLKRHLL